MFAFWRASKNGTTPRRVAVVMCRMALYERLEVDRPYGFAFTRILKPLNLATGILCCQGLPTLRQ